jgi:predicted ribosomally synthesized peptide with nif11-like leader
MSQASAVEFLDQLNTNSELQQKVMGLGKEAPFEKLQPIASAAGFNFTPDELDAASKASSNTVLTDTELSEADLDQVAGGTGNLVIVIRDGSRVIVIVIRRP